MIKSIEFPERINQKYGIIDIKTGLCVDFGHIQGDCECPSWHEKKSGYGKHDLEDCLNQFLPDLEKQGYSVELFIWK